MALDLKDDQGLISTYEKYHLAGEIWPEIPVGIKESGVYDMQIYRIGTRLFMLIDHDLNTDLKDIFDKMKTMPKQVEWAKLMGEFQKKIPEVLSGAQWTLMKPIFLLNEHIK